MSNVRNTKTFTVVVGFLVLAGLIAVYAYPLMLILGSIHAFGSPSYADTYVGLVGLYLLDALVKTFAELRKVK
jgi:hypothetical protein